MFFNKVEMEAKALKLGEKRINFFRPFNSAFERATHTASKQRSNFNHNVAMNNRDLPGQDDQKFLNISSFKPNNSTSQKSLKKMNDFN